MAADDLFLKQNIQIEPLISSWYAWSHLIPPATAARHLTERHIPIMDSYIAAPHVHAAAVRNPKMLGGPFIDYQGQRVDEIRRLREESAGSLASLIQLSAALPELDGLLRRGASGRSLHPLYSEVPHALRGYVELVYDRHHRASFRLLESLLYRSPYYQRSSQTLMLSAITADERPFVLSTPRLTDPTRVQLSVAFDDPRVDELFRLKTRAQPWSTVCDMFDLNADERALLRTFFTETPPPPYQAYQGSGVRWRYFGHACILVEVAGMALLLDPVLSYTYETPLSRYTYADLPDTIDYVLITHNHIDHLLFETLLQLRHKVRTVVVPHNEPGSLIDPSMALMLRQCGFKNVVELGELAAIDDGPLSITAWPFLGEHGDLAIATKASYLVRARGESLLFAADSCNIEPELYRHLHQAFGDVSVLFLGMECNGAPMSWFYGPLMLAPVERVSDQSRRLSGSNYIQAIEMVAALESRDVYVYAMGQEPWLNYVMSIKYTDESRPIVESNQLIAECNKRGLICERLFGEKEIRLEAHEFTRSVSGSVGPMVSPKAGSFS